VKPAPDKWLMHSRSAGGAGKVNLKMYIFCSRSIISLMTSLQGLCEYDQDCAAVDWTLTRAGEWTR
jgi:hypothetical protein